MKAKWESIFWIVVVLAIFGSCSLNKHYDQQLKEACIEKTGDPKCKK